MSTNKGVAGFGISRLGNAPAAYEKQWMDDSFGQINRTLTRLNGTNQNQTILSGAGVPGSGLGAVGDLYLDTTSSVLYGPKTSSGWGSGVALVGQQGPAGPTGPQGPPGVLSGGALLSGSTTPPSTAGANGDFWYNTATFILYGPYYYGWPITGRLVGVIPAGPVSHQWVRSIDSSGNLGLSQPSFSDVSGILDEAAGGTGASTFLAADLPELSANNAFGGTLNSFNGTVLINTLVDDGIDMLQVSGNTLTTGLHIKAGVNTRVGSATLAAGTVTVSNTRVTATSMIFITASSASAASGSLAVTTITPGVSFIVQSSASLDTNSFNYLIVETL